MNRIQAPAGFPGGFQCYTLGCIFHTLRMCMQTRGSRVLAELTSGSFRVALSLARAGDKATGGVRRRFKRKDDTSREMATAR